MEVTLIGYPKEDDWIEVKRRALITMYGKALDSISIPAEKWRNQIIEASHTISPPTEKWKHQILEARHSPIRYLTYSFLITDIPSNIATHLVRHVHSQPYVSSLRNDRQDSMNGDLAPRNTPVNMIFDVNAEELMVIANKRLCAKAAIQTQEVVREMCREAEKVTPELSGLLVPMCEYQGNVCHEMKPCGKCKK